MSQGRPGFEHRPERHGLVGPFSGRQLGAVVGAVVVAVVLLVALTRPLASVDGGGPVDPRPTVYLLGSPTVGLQPGSLAPELAGTRADGTPWMLTDVSGRPVRLADLRGKAVWLNFWATWCPPCQAETPILRDAWERYRARGLELVGVSVQETNAEDVAAYARKYALGYTIAADLSADVFHLYRVYALPTQVFIGPDGVIRRIIQGPLTAEAAAAVIETILPQAESMGPTPGPSPTP